MTHVQGYRGKGCHLSPEQLITVNVVPHGLQGARYVTAIRAAALLDAFQIVETLAVLESRRSHNISIIGVVFYERCGDKINWQWPCAACRRQPGRDRRQSYGRPIRQADWRRIAVNIAKLPVSLRPQSDSGTAEE